VWIQKYILDRPSERYENPLGFDDEVERRLMKNDSRIVSPVMTTREVCAYLGIHKSTLFRLIASRKIPFFRIGSDYRFNQEEIDEWMMSR
jgi:excisionase family DNA binding protein